jgi:hypothetical protein
MKKSVITTIALALSLTALTAVTASAREVVKRVVTVNFDFVAGGQTLPAGTYTVQFLNGNSASQIVVIRSLDGRAQALAHFNFAQAKPETTEDAVFESRGDKRYLRRVQLGDSTYTLELIGSR